MTIAEAEIFYKMDKEKYNLKNNEYFLKWYSKQIKNGYLPYLQLFEMQEFIDTIVLWYEIKYPEKEFEFYEGIREDKFKNVKPISKILNFQQLMFRLSNIQSDIVDCVYRAHGGGYPDKIFFGINIIGSKSHSYCIVSANYKTGIISSFHSSEQGIKIDCSKQVTLDELLKILENSEHLFDLEELKTSVNNHNIDLEIRKKLLQYVALKLLYSKNTIPERGYERAKRFIGEFNKHIPNLNLNTTEIDKILEINYKEKSEKSYNVKKLFKNR